MRRIMVNGLAKYHEYIRLAIKRGFSFDFETLELITPSGTRVKPKLHGSQRYPSYTFNSLSGIKVNVSFPIHKFVAYILYGEASFSKGVNVRHLDGDTLNLSKDNIVLGTSQENQYDKPEKSRQEAAKKARAAQGLRPVNSIVTESMAEAILLEYFEKRGEGIKAPRGLVKGIAEKYGLNRNTVQSICNGINFKDLYIKFNGEEKYV